MSYSRTQIFYAAGNHTRVLNRYFLIDCILYFTRLGRIIIFSVWSFAYLFHKTLFCVDRVCNRARTFFIFLFFLNVQIHIQTSGKCWRRCLIGPGGKKQTGSQFLCTEVSWETTEYSENISSSPERKTNQGFFAFHELNNPDWVFFIFMILSCQRWKFGLVLFLGYGIVHWQKVLKKKQILVFAEGAKT